MGRGFNKAERLIRMERLLLAHPEGLHRAEIARRLGVHRSTVGRDIDELSLHVSTWHAGAMQISDGKEDLTKIWNKTFQATTILKVNTTFRRCPVARLFKGEKDRNEGRIQRLLRRHGWGLREAEIAQELGWERRRLNNYLRGLESRGHVYKEGRCWFVDE